MTTQPVSVTLPVSQAFGRVSRLLFRPFDLGKWFVIGFCAWLAVLGESGGSYNFHVPGGGNRNPSVEFEHVRHYVMNNLYWIVPVAASVVVFCVALGVVITWLNSRGKFMFLHCVALNKAEIAVPWNRFAREANSLFWFRIVLGLIGATVMIPFVVLIGIVVAGMASRHEWNVGSILVGVGTGLVMIAIGIVLLIIRKLTMDFVVPIMFLRGKRCLECWGELRRLLTARFGDFLLYLLFQILIHVVIGAVVLMVVIATCCIAGCLLAIPYLGTVLFLPALVFTRSYSLYYLAQYGPEYDVFPPAAPPA